VTVKITAYWTVTTCSVVGVYRCFSVKSCFRSNISLTPSEWKSKPSAKPMYPDSWLIFACLTIWPEEGGDIFVWNIGLPLNYTLLQPLSSTMQCFMKRFEVFQITNRFNDLTSHCVDNTRNYREISVRINWIINYNKICKHLKNREINFWKIGYTDHTVIQLRCLLNVSESVLLNHCGITGVTLYTYYGLYYQFLFYSVIYVYFSYVTRGSDIGRKTRRKDATRKTKTYVGG
jgi:hypothetical protein